MSDSHPAQQSGSETEGDSDCGSLAYDQKLRRSIRFPSDTDRPSFFAIQVGEGQWEAGRLTDESSRGIGVEVAQTHGLQIGQQVRLIYYGAPEWAYVRQIWMVGDGTWWVGLEGPKRGV